MPDALSDRFPKFVITTNRLYVADSRRFGVAEPLQGAVGILEVHIVNTSPAQGNLQSIDISIDVAPGDVRNGVPVVPMFIQIWWRKERAQDEPVQQNIEIPPDNYLTELIDGPPLTHNRGLTRWYVFFMQGSIEELQNGVIALSVKNAAGHEFRGISRPDPKRQMGRGYSL